VRFDGTENGPFSAAALSPYGDPNQGSVTYYRGDPTWKRDPSELDGTPYIQIRLSFHCNAEAGLAPELSAFGLSYSVE
jgi:hypothetical protein